MLSNEVIGLLSLLATVACYWVNKRLYRKHPHPLLMPIVATPMVLIGLWHRYNCRQHSQEVARLLEIARRDGH